MVKKRSQNRKKKKGGNYQTVDDMQAQAILDQQYEPSTTASSYQPTIINKSKSDIWKEKLLSAANIVCGIIAVSGFLAFSIWFTMWFFNLGPYNKKKEDDNNS